MAMIASIHGTLESVGDDHVVVRVSGFGIRVYVPSQVADTVGAVGQQVTLHTTLRIHDDTPTLYGFPTSEGKRLFDLLLDVSGVGPRHSLGLLSAMTPDEVAVAIVSGNADALSSVRGIGKRTAGRILVDLKARLLRDWVAAPIGERDSHNDVVAALQALGYSAAEAQKAVLALEDVTELPLEEQVRLALQQLARE